jgi:hypothetical protein
MNLHSLWDTALVELEQGIPAEIAARSKLKLAARSISSGSKDLRQTGRLNRWQ